MRRREFITIFGGAVASWPREFIALLSGVASWPFEARAQQSNNQVRRIGLLMLVAETDPQARAERTAFTKELQRLGWIEGQNIQIDQRWAIRHESQRRYA